MIITISGLAGTGTTSLSAALSNILGFEYIYAGKIFRDEAKKLNMEIGEFAEYLSNHPDLDRAIDYRMIEFAQTHTHSILEGRLSAWMVHKQNIPALKILLRVPLDISAQRVADRDEIDYKEAMFRVKNRDSIDRERYLKLYNIDINDSSVYDIIFDTSRCSLEEEILAVESIARTRLSHI